MRSQHTSLTSHWVQQSIWIGKRMVTGISSFTITSQKGENILLLLLLQIVTLNG